MVVLAALVTVVLRNVIHRQDRASAASWFMWLAVAGVGTFTAMEIVERLATGAPVADLLQTGLLPTGIAIQVLLAGVSALAIRWLLRAVENVRGTSATASVVPRLVGVGGLAAGWQLSLRLLPSADGIRGPPGVR